MATRRLQEAVKSYEDYYAANGADEQLVNAYVMATSTAYIREKDREMGLRISTTAKKVIEEYCLKQTGGTIYQLDKYCYENKKSFKLLEQWYDVLRCEAANRIFDSYMLYLEKKRNPTERFYAPKRKQFMKIGLVQAMQDMLDDKLDILTISLPPGTGKTTIEKFFHSGLMGWYPNHYNLFYSHSSDITRMYYEGVLNILTDADEYAWAEIFPHRHVLGTNAKLEQINIDKYKPFPNLQTTSVGSKNAGKVRCNKFLLVDDMIGGIEEALNKSILDKLWDKYAVDARQRKIQDENGVICKEIHIATRWSVHDVIGRLQRAYEGNPRAKFIAVPDVDPVTGESNFDYECNGFTKEFFADQALLMDDISYRCLYKNEPIEREGLLYHEEDLRRYFTRPEREPDAIIGTCDTKNKGTDFMVLPVMYRYGDDYYMEDCVCDDSADYGLQYQRLTNLILDHAMQQVEFESNSGGDRVAHEVSKMVENAGGRCNITTKPTETNKETRIIVNSDWIKKHVLFKDQSLYQYNSDYGRFMRFVLSYSVAGKNEHDDVCDCLANFALYTTKERRVNRIEVPINPFRSMTSGYYDY